MVLPRARRPLPCLEYDVALAMPDIPREPAIPRTDVAGSHRIAEPSLHKVSTVGESSWADGGAGAAATRNSSKAHNILVVGATDVAAGLGYRCQIDALGRLLDLARPGVAALECRSPRHDYEELYWGTHSRVVTRHKSWGAIPCGQDTGAARAASWWRRCSGSTPRRRRPARFWCSLRSRTTIGSSRPMRPSRSWNEMLEELGMEIRLAGPRLVVGSPVTRAFENYARSVAATAGLTESEAVAGQVDHFGMGIENFDAERVATYPEAAGSITRGRRNRRACWSGSGRHGRTVVRDRRALPGHAVRRPLLDWRSGSTGLLSATAFRVDSTKKSRRRELGTGGFGPLGRADERHRHAEHGEIGILSECGVVAKRLAGR